MSERRRRYSAPTSGGKLLAFAGKHLSPLIPSFRLCTGFVEQSAAAAASSRRIRPPSSGCLAAAGRQAGRWPAGRLGVGGARRRDSPPFLYVAGAGAGIFEWVIEPGLNRSLLFQVFGEDRIRAFGMAKFLSAHLS